MRENRHIRDSSMADQKPLTRMAEAFGDLAAIVSPDATVMEVASFSRASSLVSPLFGLLGIAFKFAEMDFVSKVSDLLEASESISTLQELLDREIEADCVMKFGSHSRNLMKVRRGLEMVRVLFEEIIASEEDSLKDPASKAYAQVLASHHSWAIRTAVAAGMYTLPTKTQLVERLNEDDASARIQMQNFIDACEPVIQYIETLFNSRNLGVDWD